ncbi:MAG: hypothetical protein HYY30_15100 [Chloroflexi bacterium]|nr:hypothetical protein [Chloroflexota bacterium]
MAFDFRQKIVEDGEIIDEEAARSYVEELIELFAESPEGKALASRGVEPGHYLDMFLDYELRYVGASPAEMDPHDIRETLDVMAEKITARPEDLDKAIPELEAFCDFVGRAFAFEKAAAWKRAIQDAASGFHRSVRDPRHWGMAKSMMMGGMSRGFDLGTKEGVNRWLSVKQAEQVARLEAETGLAPKRKMSLGDRLLRAIGIRREASIPAPSAQEAGELYIGDLAGDEPDLLTPGPPTTSPSSRKKNKARRKQAKANRRKNRR